MLLRLDLFFMCSISERLKVTLELEGRLEKLSNFV
jgi:hypothetical protein